MSTIIIKIGGGKGIDPTRVAGEIASLVASGERVVLVHGGSHETNELAEALGHPTQTITSPSGHTSRRTDRRTLDIFNMAYCGRVNKAVVESLRRRGADAVGLSGLDAGIWIGTRKSAIRAVEDGRTVLIRDDLSGKVDRVDTDFLNTLLGSGRVPVLTPPAVTPDGIAINVDADRAAAATAAALGADELLLLSNVPALLRDPSDPDSRIEQVNASTIEAARSAARGRMKNKVLAAEEAIVGGVTRVVIASAAREHAIAAARAGEGTVFTSTRAEVNA
ncbi:MAG: [LysW]-aminoadipate kinase [Phycisphaerales bacterium]|nr:MAG: [LysW]-aminoadipate kinase [Phycisphaerales bacterium]